MKDWETPIEFYAATYHTRHFTFEGFGPSRETALAAIRLALVEHARQIGEALVRAPSELSWVEESMAEIRDEPGAVRKLAFGFGYRDGEEMDRL